jgi:hypothetical protein
MQPRNRNPVQSAIPGGEKCPVGSPYVSGRSPDWLKMKNVDAPGGEARRRGRLGQRQMAMIEAGQDVLILKRASASRSSGEWSDDDFDVLANGVVLGRIFKANAAPVGMPWMWTLALATSA